MFTQNQIFEINAALDRWICAGDELTYDRDKETDGCGEENEDEFQ